jgi:hypothetical protein
MRWITSILVFALVVFVCPSAWSDDKDADKAARKQSADNLKAIGKAFHAYAGWQLSDKDPPKEVQDHPLPAHAIYSKDGKKPLLSWRVEILPQLGHEALYKEFKLDEPWDSEHNKKLIAKMPKVYAGPGAPEEITKEGKTYYQVFTGEQADGKYLPSVFPLPSEGFPLVQMCWKNINDGTSNTILAVEARDPVIWTKPDDLKLPADEKKIPAVGGLFKNGFHVLFCDDDVFFYRPDPPVGTMRALITPAGAEPVDRKELVQKTD